MSEGQQLSTLSPYCPNKLSGVVYVPPSLFFKALDFRSKHGNRSAVVHSLIRACGLERLCDVQPLRPATLAEALLAHSRHYLSVLYASSAYCHRETDKSFTFAELDDFHLGSEEEERMNLGEFGLIDDCATFPGVWELALLTVGGAVVAAQRLIAKRAKVACWFDGGRHHAMFDSARGFCYLNDAVVACKVLLSYPGISKVLYVDIDIHHGDGVEESFLYDDAVTTISFHLAERGFYPGTGHDVLPSQTTASYSALRVPLRRGIRNEAYVNLFDKVITTVICCRKPDVVVLQCGCDGAAGDPLGGFNLTGEAYTACLKRLLDFDIPVLILGGGGYDPANSARVWADVLQTCIVDVARKNGEQDALACLTRDVPFHDDFFELYGPTFTRDVRPVLMDDENTKESLRQISDCIERKLMPISSMKRKENNANQ